eukprot:scaffold3402_cov169-Amphora_coffeaeformis.AAC.19
MAFSSTVPSRPCVCCHVSRQQARRKGRRRLRILMSSTILIVVGGGMTRVQADPTQQSRKDHSVPCFDELGDFIARGGGNNRQRRTVSASFEERVSRYRAEQQSRLSPTFTTWEGVFEDESSSPSSSSTQQPWLDDMGYAENTGEGVHDTGITFDLRDKLRSIRKFLRRPGRGQSFTETQDGVSPLAYRYYGRKRTRQSFAGSVPIILLGPNADHWKTTAQQLQQQGFAVIACERVFEEDMPIVPNKQENLQLIVNLLDALRWKNALIVACDEEAVGAINIALQMAPDRISGLVLCGDLSSATEFASNLLGRSAGQFGVDAFLQQSLPCPFTIVWDGDTAEADAIAMGSESNNVPDTDPSVFQQHRSLILGGGAAPHRRRPEQLAWVITRFVEENLARKIVSLTPPTAQRSHTNESEEKILHELPFGLGAVFSQESFVVTGRLLATAIAYGVILKVGLYQYESFRSGIFDFQTRLHDLLYTPEKVASTIVKFFIGIPRLIGMLFVSNKRVEDSAMLDDSRQEAEEAVQDQVLVEDESTTTTNRNETDTTDDNKELTNPNSTSTDSEDSEQEKDVDETGPIEEEKHMNYGPLFFLDNIIV